MEKNSQKKQNKKTKLEGVIVAIQYKNEVFDPNLPEEDPGKYRPTIYVWIRDKNLKKHRIAIKGFRPYFFTRPWLESKAHALLEQPEIEEIIKEKYEKISLLRVYTYIPGHVRKLKRMIQSKFAQAAVLEGDVLFELRYLIDKGIRASVIWDGKELKPLSKEFHIPLRRLYLDIEIWSLSAVKEGRMGKNDYIKCLTVYDNYLKKYYTWYVNKKEIEVKNKEDNWILIRCDSPKELVRNFLEFVKEYDPDVITGYNVDYDLLNLRQEALRNDLKDEWNYLSGLYDLGYTVRNPVNKRHRIRGVDWSRKGIILDGREVIDLLDLIRMISKTQLPQYTLDYVVKRFLSKDEGKIRYKGKPVAPLLQIVWVDNPEIVLRYNKYDVELCVKLDEKNDLIDFLDELRKTVGVRLSDAFSTQRMIDTEALRRRKIPLPSKFTPKGSSNLSYKGAFVVEPLQGFHKWVACLDYKSLYPAIMRTFNIDVDTYVGNKYLKRECFEFSNEDGSKTWRFLKKPRGLFPQMLDDFLTLREHYKKLAKIEKDPQKRKVADRKQDVFKILANACYGSFAYRSRKHSLECAEAVTTFGQKCIKFASKIAREMGMEVVYGDTDSIFVKPHTKNYGETYNESLRLQERIMKEFPSFLRQFGVSKKKHYFFIKLEKIYDSFFIATKKRYCGRVMKPDGRSFLDVKGLDTKRSDTSIFAAKLQRMLLEMILDNRKKELIKEVVCDKLNSIPQVSLTELGVPSAISKPLKAYVGNPLQKRAAMNSNKYLNTNYKYGDKPRRIYIIPPEVKEIYPKTKFTEVEFKEKQEELKGLYAIAFDETIDLPDWVRVDYRKMLIHTIKPKIERLLEAIGISWDEIELKLKPELRKVKKRRKVENNTSLDQFLR
ncbi:MAG: hypothetical protein DRJ03_15455 [Chloroflexi bacterium]|nr:MAG: hypothetical protein DRJ03_15455 [Chloroflexota bacterium]